MTDERDYYDDEDFDEGYDDYADDPCRHCGPSCDEWGGDGICMVEIREQARQDEEYTKYYVHESVHCPNCGKELTMFDIPMDELWLWPGDFYNFFIPLSIYAVYDVPKGELHRFENTVHVWIGVGENRHEKLIRLLGKGNYHQIETEQETEAPMTVQVDEEIPF